MTESDKSITPTNDDLGLGGESTARDAESRDTVATPAGENAANPASGATDDEAAQPGRPASTVARVVGWLVAGGLVGYLVVYPVVELSLMQWHTAPGGSEIPDMSLAELVQLRAVQVFAGVWAFAFGACIGSFLNVLVYRQPLGITVLTRPSQCPKCDTKLESRDNIPVVGWLRLGGRCRACDAPISSRYPIIESIAGIVFTLIVFFELTSGGANLPVRRLNSYTGFVWTVFYPKWDLIALTFYHFHCFAMLLTWGLMNLDGSKIPKRSAAFALGVGIAAPLLWSKLAVVPPMFVGTDSYPQEFAVVAASVLAGGFAGLAIAAVASCSRVTSIGAAAPSLLLLGVTLGWQAVVCIGVASMVISGVGFFLRKRPLNFVLTVAAAGFVHHLFWRTIYRFVTNAPPPPEWG